MAGPIPKHVQVNQAYDNYDSSESSTGSSRTRNVRKEHRAAGGNTTQRNIRPYGAKPIQGTAVRTSGYTMRQAGGAMRRVGAFASAQGEKMGDTRVGRVLQDFGEAARVAGSGSRAAGQIRSKNGQQIAEGTKIESDKKAASLRARAKATATSASIWAWAAPSWFLFQLPFAIFNIVFFGISSAYLDMFGFDGESDTARSMRGVSGYLITGVGFLAGGASEVIEALTGYDLGGFFANVLDPTLYFMASWGLITAYGLVVLFAAALIYALAGLKPLWGNNATFKISAFLLCLIGYTLPVINMLPWVLLWTGAVWKDPK